MSGTACDCIRNTAEENDLLCAGTVNGILAEGLLDAASISGLSGRDPITSVLAAAQASQLYLSIRTTRQDIVRDPFGDRPPVGSYLEVVS